jgi:transcriptional regulator with XRE-family HTH domain
MKHGRPYPPDKERRIRVRIELAKRNMNISQLALALIMPQSMVSEIINGIRRSFKTEEKIAAFFGKSHDELFPPRSRDAEWLNTIAGLEAQCREALQTIRKLKQRLSGVLPDYKEETSP